MSLLACSVASNAPAIVRLVLFLLLCSFRCDASLCDGDPNTDATCCTQCLFTDTTESAINVATSLSCYETVYDEPYNTSTSLSDLMKLGAVENVSDQQYVLVGAKASATTSEYKVAAVGRYVDVFRPTTKVGLGYEARQGLGLQAAFWYRADYMSLGFAPNKDIVLALADTNAVGCGNRLSWQIDNSFGGWRAGCGVGDQVSTWRKVLKYCTSLRVGPPAGIELMAYKPELLQVTHIQTWQPGASPAPIRFATATTLDCCSKYASLGQVFRQAYGLLCQYVNTVRGGILVKGVRHPLSMTLADDRSDGLNVKTITEELVTEGVRFFLGPYGSPLSKWAAPVVQQAGGVMVASVATAGYVFDNRPNVFGVYMAASKSFITPLTTLKAAGAMTVAYVQESVYPKSTCGAIGSIADGLGMQVKWNYTFYSDDISGDLDAVMSRLKDPSQKADVLLGCVYKSACHALVKTIIDRRIDVNAIVLTVCVSSSDFTSTFGDQGRYFGGMASWLPSMDFTSEITNWTAKDFNTSYYNAYGSEPSYHAALCWTAGIALVAAIEQADTTNTTEVVNVLKAMDIETIFGRVKFGSSGLNTNDWKVIQHLPGSATALQVAPYNGIDFVYPIPAWSLRECFSSSKCTKGLKDGQCVFCSEDQAARWAASGIGNAEGCVCLPRICSPGAVVVIQAGTVNCVACEAGKYAANIGVCTACAEGSFAASEKSSACTLCPRGKVSNATGVSACTDCEPGRVTYVEGDRYCQSCRIGTNASQKGSSTCLLCEPGTVAMAEEARFCEECAPGRISVWGAYNCTDCPKGKFQALSRMSFCTDCFLGTDCSQRTGVTSPDNEADFWRYRNPPELDMWLPCSDTGLCLRDERCAKGQTGLLCAVCLPGYTRSFNSATCHECTNWYVQAFLVCLGALSMMGGTFFTVSVAVRAVGSGGKSVTDALFKLLINYLITISVTCEVFIIIYMKKVEHDTMRTGKLINESNNIFVKLLSLSISDLILPLLNAPCLFDKSVAEEDQKWVALVTDSNHSEHFMSPDVQLARQWLADFHWEVQLRQMVFWLVSPPLFILANMFFAFIVLVIVLHFHRAYFLEVKAFVDDVLRKQWREAAMQKGIANDREKVIKMFEARNHALFGLYPYLRYVDCHDCMEFMTKFALDSKPIVVVGLFLLYPTLVESLLDPLRCEEPATGKAGIVHSRSYDLECYEMDDTLFWLAIGGVLVYCIGFPSVALFKLYRSTRVWEPKFLRTWGFMMSGYEIGQQYWECVILFRKSLSLILVALSLHEGMRVLLLLLFAASFSLMHISQKPFDNRLDELLDRVESRHLMIWVLFCLFILWLYLNTLDNTDDHSSATTDTEVSDAHVYMMVGIMACIHILFILTIVSDIVRLASVSHAEFLVRRAEKRQQLVEVGSSEQVEVATASATASSYSIGAEVEAEEERKALERRAHFSLASGSTKDSDDSAGRINTWRSSIASRLHKATNHLRFVKIVVMGEDSSSYMDKFESTLIGELAKSHYQHYVDHKAHLVCDCRNMWFTLLGNKSSKMKPHTASKLSQIKVPGTVLPATEHQRRYLLKIIMEAFEYVIVTIRCETFSVSLLEFVLRCGFAFTGAGEVRMEIARSHRGGQDTSDTVAAKLMRSQTVTSGGSRPSQGSNDGVRIRSPASASSWFPAISSANEAGRWTEEEITAKVKEMFEDDIFDTALSLEDLQHNLGSLRTTSEDNLRTWLSMFEKAYIIHRNARLRALHETKRRENEETRIAKENSQKTKKAPRRRSIGDSVDAQSVGKGLDKHLRNMVKFERNDFERNDFDQPEMDESSEDSSEHSSSSSMAGLMADEEAANTAEMGVQAAIHADDTLSLIPPIRSDVPVPLIPQQSLKTDRALEDQVAEQIKKEKAEAEREKPIIEKWLRVSINLIQKARIAADHSSASFALQRAVQHEKRAQTAVTQLRKDIAEAKATLLDLRLSPLDLDLKQDQNNEQREEMKALADERDDLQQTLEAISEARQEIKALKDQIASNKARLNPGVNLNRMEMINEEDFGDDEQGIGRVLDGSAQRPIPSGSRSCAPFRAQCIGIGR